ncbi:MAG: bacteriocin class II family protein [Streptococcus sp.]|nr:bacteriocin class II family protein [Streptococcus sp.]
MEKKDNQSIVAVSEKFQTLNEKELSKIIGGDVRRTQFWNLFPRK